MSIFEGDRVRFNRDARTANLRPLDYTGLVAEADYESGAELNVFVVWNGGQTFGWFKSSELEVVP